MRSTSWRAARRTSGWRRGLKLHIANSRVDYHNPEHVERLRRLFAAANGYRMAIVVHMRTSINGGQQPAAARELGSLSTAAAHSRGISDDCRQCPYRR
jgi:hypothetical protein